MPTSSTFMVVFLQVKDKSSLLGRSTATNTYKHRGIRKMITIGGEMSPESQSHRAMNRLSRWEDGKMGR